MSFFDVTESDRLKMRTSAGWHRQEYEGEPPTYRDLQERRAKEILAIPYQQERLDNFVQFAQSRLVKNLTENGFRVVDVDPELHARLKQRLHTQRGTARRESTQKLQGIYGPTIPKFVSHGEPQLLTRLQPTMERWVSHSVPEGLEPSTAYGMRVYERGSSLSFHTDRVETHVVSGILHVDHGDYDRNDAANDSSAWPIEIEGHDGQRHAVDLKPGQMLLYESAKCVHGRSKRLEAEYYASVFVHFRPKTSWPYTIHDVWLAVPPGWKAGSVDTQGAGPRWAGAFLTHASMTVAGMAPEYPPGPKKTLLRRAEPEIKKAQHAPVQEEKKTVPPPKKPPPPPPKKTSPEEEEEEEERELHRPRQRQRRPPPPKTRRELLGDDDHRIRPATSFDDDDELVKDALGVGVGGALVATLVYGLGACTVLATATLVLRRAFLTKGRSLVRRKHLKTDDPHGP